MSAIGRHRGALAVWQKLVDLQAASAAPQGLGRVQGEVEVRHLVRLGQIEEASYRLASARELFEKTLGRNCEQARMASVLILSAQLDLALAQGEPSLAADHLEGIVAAKLSGPLPGILLSRGFEPLQRARVAMARGNCREALEMLSTMPAPDEAEAFFRRQSGQLSRDYVALRCGDTQAASDIYERWRDWAQSEPAAQPVFEPWLEALADAARLADRSEADSQESRHRWAKLVARLDHGELDAAALGFLRSVVNFGSDRG